MNNLSCLKDIIGYKTPCEVSASRSGYFVNQIKGVSFRFAESIADEEYRTGKEFIAGLIDQAKNMVIDEMVINLSPYFRQNTLQASTCMCTFIDGYESEYAGERGIEIRKVDASQYKRIYIPRVVVCVQTTTSIVIKIDDGGRITTFAAVTVQGGVQTEIELDYQAQFDTVKVYYDQTGVNVRNTSCTIGCLTCSGVVKRFNNENASLLINGFDQSGLLSSTTFSGIIPCVAVVCVPENLVCDFVKYLGLPMVYKWGGLFYSEVGMTKRINKYTMHTREEAQQMAAYYDSFEQPLGMYQKQMRSVINSIFPYLNSINDECIECNTDHYGWTTG